MQHCSCHAERYGQHEGSGLSFTTSGEDTMSAPQVPQAALTASLWFAVARKSQVTRPQGAQPLPDDIVEAVTTMFEGHDAPEQLPEILEAVAAGRELIVHDATLTLSAGGYDRLRKEAIAAFGLSSGPGKSLWPVGGTTILKRAGGSWSRALEQAGLATSSDSTAAASASSQEASSERPQGSETGTAGVSGFGRARFSAEDFRAAIREFKKTAEHTGQSLSYQSYVDWRKEQVQQGRKDLPSGPALRNTCGSWKSAVENDGAPA